VPVVGHVAVCAEPDGCGKGADGLSFQVGGQADGVDAVGIEFGHPLMLNDFLFDEISRVQDPAGKSLDRFGPAVDDNRSVVNAEAEDAPSGKIGDGFADAVAKKVVGIVRQG